MANGSTRGQYERRPQQRAVRRSRPGVGVAVITLAALAVVGVLAIQASGTQPAGAASSSPSAHPNTRHGTSGTKSQVSSTALPANSGSGARVVFSLSEHRVWLVTEAGQVQQTFEVVPATVLPSPGTYEINGRSDGTTGSDGVTVQYIVYYAASSGSAYYAFDAVADTSGMPPPPQGETRGTRTTQADALAIWNFAPNGTDVVVVP